MESSSEKFASQFMSEGRPAGDGLQSTGMHPGDVSVELTIKTPQAGCGFAEWATGGYDFDGCASGKVGRYNYKPEPGPASDYKANMPQRVKVQNA